MRTTVPGAGLMDAPEVISVRENVKPSGTTMSRPWPSMAKPGAIVSTLPVATPVGVSSKPPATPLLNGASNTLRSMVRKNSNACVSRSAVSLCPS